VKATKEAGQTFDPIIDRYLEKVKDERASSYYDANKLYLQRHFKALHKTTLASIDRATVGRELHAITKAKGPTAANRSRAALSAFFNWAIREGLTESNPVDNTNKNKKRTAVSVCLPPRN
jgi:site-specific recombinase XerD